MKTCHRYLAVLTLVGLSVVTAGFGQNSWHNLLLRTPEERQSRFSPGDGSQIPKSITYSSKMVGGQPTVFMGVDTAGVYRSDDGGATWTSKMEGMNAFFVKSIAVDPVNPDVVYALVSTHVTANLDVHGLYRSLNNGDTWTLLKKLNITNPPEIARAIAIDPSSLDAGIGRCAILYVGTSDGLWKLTDSSGGVTSTQLSTGLIGSRRVTSIDFRAGLSPSVSIITVATYDGVFRSTDGGANFSDISTGLPTTDGVEGVTVTRKVTSLAVDPVDTSVMFATYEPSLPQVPKLFKKTASTDWTEVIVTTPALTGGRFYDVVIHPADNSEIMLGVMGNAVAKNPFISIDGGATWRSTFASKPKDDRFNTAKEDVGNYISARIAFAPNPATGGSWLAGFNYGSIYRTQDAGATWTWSNAGYGGSRFASFAFNENSPQHMCFGGTDMGVVTSFDGGQTFKKAKFGKGLGEVGHVTAVAIDPASTSPETARVIASVGNYNVWSDGRLFVSNDGGRTFSLIAGTSGYQAGRIIWDSVDHDYLYAGSRVSSDGGTTWQNVLNTAKFYQDFGGATTTALSSLIWSAWTEGGQTSSSGEIFRFKTTDVATNRVRFAVRNTAAAFDSMVWAAQTDTSSNRTKLSFTNTPVTVSAELDAGTTPYAQAVLELNNGSGSYIYVSVMRNATGNTATTRYEIRDGTTTTGPIVISSAASSSLTAKITAAPNYLIISCGGTVVLPTTSMANTTNYYARVGGRTNVVSVDPAYVYADNVSFSTVPLQIVGSDASNPTHLYAYDGVTWYKSTNFGSSWSRLLTRSASLSLFADYQQLMASAVMNSARTKLYAGSNDGVFIFDIASQTETVVKTGLQLNMGNKAHIGWIEIDPTDDMHLYAGESSLYYGNGGWISESTDGGSTWSAVSATRPFGNRRTWGLGIDPAGRVFGGSDHGSFWFGGTTAPSAPSGVGVSPSTAGNIVTWSAVASASTYNVYRKTSSSGAFAQLAPLGGGVAGITFTDLNVVAGTEYYYAVQGGNLSGEGSLSSSVSAVALQRTSYSGTFDGSGPGLPSDWAYDGSTYSSASVVSQRLQHNLLPPVAWGGESRVVKSPNLEFSYAPLWISATLDSGSTALTQSGIRLKDAAGNHISVFQNGAGILYSYQDGSTLVNDTTIGTYSGTSSTIKIRCASNGLKIYRVVSGSPDTLIKSVDHDFGARSGYVLQAVGRSGTVSTSSSISAYADNISFWKESYYEDFGGVNGSLPKGFERVWEYSQYEFTGDAGCESGELRLTIKQSAGFRSQVMVKKQDRLFDFGSSPLTIQAYIKTVAPLASVSRGCIRLQQDSTDNYTDVFLQSDGKLLYQIVDGSYNSGEVKIETDVPLGSEGLFRFVYASSGLEMWIGDTHIKTITKPQPYANTSNYRLMFMGTSSAASSGSAAYVSFDNVNVY